MPTIKQKKAIDNVVENGGNVSKAMLDAGYSANTAKTPQKLTESKGWLELMDSSFSDEDIALKHKELLNSTHMDHMVFPLGPKGEDDVNLSGGRSKTKEDQDGIEVAERTTLTDKEIIEMLAEVNCKVRRIVHGETARHVYFWSSDNKARQQALDMAYKLKGKYAPDKSINMNLIIESVDPTDPIILASLKAIQEKLENQ